ncbi:MAG: flavodoxin [Erysipelotrichaceae bacterium]|nr:flavodoxin [Erysipelotrichaceae bacterium]
MKKLLIIILSAFLLVGCKNNEVTEKESISQTTQESKILVAYFSATGSTETIAEMICETLNAYIYEIVPVDAYTTEDLDYNNENSRTSIEMNNDSCKVEIASTTNIDQYDYIFIGYPIWWGQAPRIIDTFLESYDFSNKTIVPFCTSTISGISSSATQLASLTNDAIWLEDQRFSNSSTNEDIKNWLDTLF